MRPELIKPMRRNRGDIRRPGKVYHLAEVLQRVEFSQPVVSHDEDVRAESENILRLLPRMIFNDHLIHAGVSPHVLHADLQRLNDTQFAPFQRVPVRGHAHDQAVAQLTRPLQQTRVAVVK